MTEITEQPTKRRFANKKVGLTAGAAALAVAIGVGGFLSTSASFTDTASVENNSITIGSVALDKPVEGTPLAVENLLPGDTVTPDDATLAFTNGGTTALAYTVTVDGLTVTGGPADLDESLFTITLTDADGNTDAGTLADLPTLTGDLATDGDAKEIKATIGLAGTADNDWQGVEVVFNLRVDASVAGA